jgi:hypothetical protein
MTGLCPMPFLIVHPLTATKVKERDAPALAAAAVTLVNGHDGKSVAKL